VAGPGVSRGGTSAPVALVLAVAAATAAAVSLAALPAQAALAPARFAGGLMSVSPEIPIVGSRVTVEVALPDGSAPPTATVQLTSPTGVHLRAKLQRVGPSLLRGTTHFADDGLWTLRVRAAGVDADGEVLVLQNGAIVPGPKPIVVPGVAPGGGLGLLGGR
jgi:hypothetical protein